jgi:methyl-accepting chemotaxis protein
MRVRLSLATLGVVIVGLLAVGVVVEIAFGRAFEVLREALQTRGIADATRLADELSFGVAAGAQSEVDSALARSRSGNESMQGLAVFGPGGARLASEGQDIPAGVVEALDADQARALSRDDLFYAAAPIMSEGRSLGRVIVMSRHRAAEELRTGSRIICYVTYLVVLVLIGLGVYLIGKRITAPVEEMVGIARGIASGDLTRPALGIAGNDEIAQLSTAINQMADALRNQVGAIKHASSNVLLNSAEVMSTTSQLASAASEQASAIAQTSSTIEEIKQTAQSAKDSARQIVETSEKSVEVSSEGLQAVAASTDEFRTIREQVEAIAGGVESLRRQVGEVGEIIATVNQIAEQSNLLAVNASIEAAKASEYGRGFAVVAQEVKSLATQSKQATAQVRATLTSIQNAIEEVFDSAREGRERTQVGVQSIEHTGEVIRRMGETISGAAKDARRIAINANEQVVGLEQVSLAMNNVNQAASENMGSTQQLEQGGQTLNSMSRELERLVAGYRLPT